MSKIDIDKLDKNLDEVNKKLDSMIKEDKNVTMEDMTEIFDLLGIEPRFKTQEEFDKFMNDEDSVLEL